LLVEWPTIKFPAQQSPVASLTVIGGIQLAAPLMKMIYVDTRRRAEAWTSTPLLISITVQLEKQHGFVVSRC
jgi:hypothetical protein